MESNNMEDSSSRSVEKRRGSDYDHQRSDDRKRDSRRTRDSSRDRKSDRNRHRHDSGDDGSAHHRRSRHHRDRSRRRDDDEDDKNKSRSDRRPRDASRSRDRSHHHSSRRSRSPPSKRQRRPYSSSASEASPPPARRSKAPLPSQDASFRGEQALDGAEPPVEKQKPNFKPTGLLAKEANTVAGTTTVLKYHEPPEARKPSSREAWRMYVFKGKDLLDTLYICQRSVWLVGRDPQVTDLLLEHPSISKQHAVVQFRYITTTNEFGDKLSKVKPYLIDLESANGTKLNGKKVEASRFVELRDADVVTFGDSEREYVLMLPPPE
ncbi:Hypothetical protein R9X50_00720200 [Acrodontium crateriforme]|uniref:FHA domain-containing protein n=1 Tax=Acrodontium crateriforme TaxID=150365 RepID=A0AAQ3MC45_9PEZI|nr:Hypothetical protein R9X50_00720200 [Acrodontium crateriforme]